MKRNLQSGISLLEMVMFIGILSTILIAVVFATTQSIRRTILSQRKILATHYAEELQEWMRGEKETDWSLFSARSGTFCMNEEIATCSDDGSCWDRNQACSADEYTLGLFKRETSLVANGTRTDVTITVSWRDGPNIFDVPLVTTFSRWE